MKSGVSVFVIAENLLLFLSQQVWVIPFCGNKMMEVTTSWVVAGSDRVTILSLY